MVCGELLRRGATYAGCECGQRAHKKCTGLPRGITGEWSCPRCVNAGEGQQEEGEEELEAGEQEPLGKCPKCGRRLRRVKTPLKCSRCCETYHLKCVEGQRLAVELARDAGTWICGECREENVAEEQEGNHPDTEVTSGARQSRGLKIIQWNCDWMATKVDELAGLVREEKPDVVVLQETKLREGDPTPHIEGYVVTRSDRKTRRPLATARGGGLAVVMREGIAYWTEKHRGNSALEALIVNIPTGGRQGRLRIVNIYIPPSGRTEPKERER